MALPHSSARYRQIAEILLSNGFSALVGQLGLTDHVPEALRHRLRARVAAGSPGTADDPGAAPLPGPARLCRALEQLGPTFVKLGQMLATRDDLLPTAYTEALTRLQDATDPVPFAAIAATVREELGIPVTEAYSQFDEAPLATASIGASAASWTTARRPPTPTASPGTSPTTPSCGSPAVRRADHVAGAHRSPPSSRDSPHCCADIVCSVLRRSPGCCACSCGAAPGVAERDGPLSGADGPLGGLYHGEGGAVPRTPQAAAATGSRGGSVSARQLPDCRIPP